MDCRDCMRLSGRYVDGEAAPAEAAALEAHLEGCPRCARRIADLGLLARAHAGLGEAALPEGLARRIVAASRKAAAGPALIAGGRLAAIVAAAAAAVVLLGIYAGSFISRSYFGETAPRYAEVTGLDYLEAYPPASLGDAIEVVAGGKTDE